MTEKGKKTMGHMECRGWKGLWLLTAFFTGILLLAARASADVIWEPEDSFYESHSEQCEYENRSYTAAGPDGEVIVYKSPVSPEVVTKLENGTAFRVSFTYEDMWGICWAVYENDSLTGWVPMDYLEVIYDYISFEEEFGDQILAEEGELDPVPNNTEVHFWNYPGSSVGHTMSSGNVHQLKYFQTYTDKTGRKWGFCRYYMGIKNMWICLDDPTADYETLYPGGGEEADLIREQGQDDSSEAAQTEQQKADSDSLEAAQAEQQNADSGKRGFGFDRIVPGGSMWLGILTAVAVVGLTVAVTVRLLKKLIREYGRSEAEENREDRK